MDSKEFSQSLEKPSKRIPVINIQKVHHPLKQPSKYPPKSNGPNPPLIRSTPSPIARRFVPRINYRTTPSSHYPRNVRDLFAIQGDQNAAKNHPPILLPQGEHHEPTPRHLTFCRATHQRLSSKVTNEKSVNSGRKAGVMITKHRGALLHRTNTGFEWLFSRRGRPSHSRGLCTRHVSIGTSALVDDSDAVGGRGSALSAFHLAGVLHYTFGTAAGTVGMLDFPRSFRFGPCGGQTLAREIYWAFFAGKYYGTAFSSCIDQFVARKGSTVQFCTGWNCVIRFPSDFNML